MPWTDGFWRESGFVYDAAGAMYWVRCPERGCTIRGLSPDSRDNLYVAAWGDRAVSKVTPDGTLTVVMRVPDPWSPSGVLIGRDGSTWLLETSKSNEARVRRIASDGRVTTY